MKQHRRLGATLAALALLISLATPCITPALASQGSNWLPTTGIYNGLTAANDVNAALDALLTCNSGSTAPTNALGGAAELGQCWIDTTSATLPILKRYTGAAWVVQGVLDVTNGIWIPAIGGGAATIASAGTTNLCASPQSLITISGTTTITSFGSSCAVGQQKMLIFSGILTLTYNSGSLIIPGAISKTTANGDIAIAVYLGSGNWRVLDYVPITGASVLSIDGRTGVFGTGNGLTTLGGNTIQPAYNTATLQASPGNPTGTTSASTVMMGLGTTCKITPAFSSRVKVEFQFNGADTAGSSLTVGVRFGTGTAPVNGAAGTGSSAGAALTSASSSTIPFNLGGIITGLTPGVAIWFDLAAFVSGGTGNTTTISCSAMEF